MFQIDLFKLRPGSRHPHCCQLQTVRLEEPPLRIDQDPIIVPENRALLSILGTLRHVIEMSPWRNFQGSNLLSAVLFCRGQRRPAAQLRDASGPALFIQAEIRGVKAGEFDYRPD
jgi:hypothetical protein